MRFPNFRFSRASPRAARRYEVGDSILDFESATTGKYYELYLSVPKSYKKDDGQTYPALYLLDGRYDFSLVENLYFNLIWDQVIDEMFIIGISYGYDVPMTERLRLGDLLPNASGGPPPGSEIFVECLKRELIPFVERRYRINPTKRILGGSSFGALFTMNALFTMPETFAAHIALSPPVAWGDYHLSAAESAFALRHEDLDKFVWYCVGSLEDPEYIDDARVFHTTLSKRSYSNLQSQFSIIEGEKHGGVKAEGYNRSLRFIFERFKAKESQAQSSLTHTG